MTIDKFSGVILIPFPFTDQTTIRKRPAVVVSSDEYTSGRPDLSAVSRARIVTLMS